MEIRNRLMTTYRNLRFSKFVKTLSDNLDNGKAYSNGRKK